MLKATPQGILCAGNICFDILVRPVEQFTWGTTTWVDSIEQQLGGNGSNTSYTLARLGVPARLLGMVGRDVFGEHVLAILNSAGVDLGGVGRSQAPTATTICAVNAAGNRLFLQRPGSSAEAFAEPIDFTPALLGGISHFHAANIFGLPLFRQHAPVSLRRAREAGLTTSFDTAWDARGRWMQDVGGCLPFIDLFFMNHDEARMLSGSTDPAVAARFLQERGAGDVVIKLGPGGCSIFTDGDPIEVPAFDVDVVDTTGAGDCFVGGFLAALHRGASYRDAARFANAVGALSVQKLGAITGIRSYAETVAWIENATTK